MKTKFVVHKILTEIITDEEGDDEVYHTIDSEIIDEDEPHNPIETTSHNPSCEFETYEEAKRFYDKV